MNHRPSNPPPLHVGVITVIAMLCLSLASPAANTPLPGWKHTGVMAVLTTPNGANLPAGAVVECFPLLVRLHRDWFDFSQARTDGADVRFTAVDGSLLPCQIEQWDAAGGTANIWVRIPRIEGNARQALRMHWGKADAARPSDGKAVFSESNGYLSVWHMNDPVRDEVGALESKDNGTTATIGMIGPARHFPGGIDITCGDKIATYPTADAPHTTELWFRAESLNTSLIGWGNEKAQGKVVMQFRAPPRIRMDCYFSEATIESEGLMALNEWNHVVFAYEKGNARIYLNGALAGKSKDKSAPMNLTNPAKLWLGSWHGGSAFTGDLDEVRVSKVTRPAEWIRLQYENQKPLQTLVGPLVGADKGFAAHPQQAVVPEGDHMSFRAKADSALKLYWLLLRDGREEVVAVDRYNFDYVPGRVTGGSSATLRLKGVFTDGVKTLDIPITITERIPDPEFTLAVPANWDGRSEIAAVIQVGNPHATGLRSISPPQSVPDDWKVEWSAGPLAVIKEIVPGKLRLLRAQNSGPLTVTATISNGGRPVLRSATVHVTEPKHDEWLQRTPEGDEQPEEGQFYARDDRNEGTLHYNGVLADPADAVFLNLFADDKLVKTVTAKPFADKSYALSVKLKPGLIKYRVEFGTRTGGSETVLRRVANLVCGDAFLIDGQSNALATDTHEQSPPETHEWIRSYGQPPADAKAAPANLWCNPVWKARKGEMAELGWWGMELAKRLVESRKTPVFIINGAVGGTRIDQHQRNEANPTDPTTIYGRMLGRVRQAKLTHGIRGILWHQGESDQGADGPTGGFGWETYQPLFIEMAAGWKRDFPNVRNYYVFQIWPNACAMGGGAGSGDRLREKQRTLPQLFSNMRILSTLGVRPPGGCHYPLVGWAEFARMAQPLIERDHYGIVSPAPLTAPNLRRVSYASAARDTLLLEFDQPIVWLNAFTDQLYLDGEPGKVASGSVAGSILTLKLKEPATAKHITYLKETKWNQDNLILGANGLAALTFCEVPISPQSENK
jgi:hypothetical protein